MRYQRGQHNQSQARAIERDPVQPLTNSPELQLIYETAPIGLAFLSTDCRYVMINQHLTEICGLPIANHLGRTVRETVPQVAEQVESIVQAILRTGESITGIEVDGQRPDGSNKDRVWITYWHPLKDRSGQIVGINVAAEEITERKRIEADLAANQEELRSINVELAERAAVQAQERDRVWNLAQDLFVVSDPSGVTFSTTMSNASRTIQNRFIAPPTSNSVISAQQQPTQYAPWRSPSITQPGASRR